MTSESLRPLRIKLTFWYLCTFAGIIVLLGGGLFVAISRQYVAQLDASLRVAAALLEQAARTREVEAGAGGRVVDAVLELHVPDRALYLLDSIGIPVTPTSAPAWVLDAARRARNASVAQVEASYGEEHLRTFAERFSLASGRVMIAAAVADKVELEDRYSSLITTFGAAAAIALVLVAGGGWLLVRQSTAPIDRNIAQMRRFMADAAHELRTPITVLRTQAEVALQQAREAPEYARALRAIEGESRRLGRVVDDLLILARADAGQRAATIARVFLDDVVGDAVGAAGAMAATRGVQLSLREFEEAPVNGDPELLRQLVMILLDNAIKFTPSGGSVVVDVGRRGSDAMVTVSDTGPGIPPEALPHVFERFWRGDPSRGRGDVHGGPTSGAGLGLAIARWIADAHHAAIDIGGTAGAGTTVSVRFPSAPASVGVSSS